MIDETMGFVECLRVAVERISKMNVVLLRRHSSWRTPCSHSDDGVVQFFRNAPTGPRRGRFGSRCIGATSPRAHPTQRQSLLPVCLGSSVPVWSPAVQSTFGQVKVW